MNNKIAILSFFVCVFLGFACTAANADEYKAKVVAVSDGDSIVVLHNNSKEKVILFGIDCPELKQDYGPQARQYTDQACFGKTVSVNVHGYDHHGRAIAEIYLPDGSDLNHELVRLGYAWWSDKYAPNDNILKQYHNAAKANKTGLWSLANPIAPWTFRNGEKSVEAVIKPAQ